MTAPKRTLALLVLCSLAGACTDDLAAASKPSSKSKEPKLAAPKVEPVHHEQPPLTATAPSLPHTILDTPKPSSEDKLEVKPMVSMETPKNTEETPKEMQPEKPDFDRPLVPEEVKIDRFVLATGVEQREPVGETDTFSTETEKIFAFVQFANEDTEPYALRVHWEKLDGPASPYGFKLEVPTAKRWRTWSFTRIRRSPGQYRAVLRTLDGEEVASRTFVIEAAPEATTAE